VTVAKTADTDRWAEEADRRRLVSYDSARKEAVVAVRAAGGLQQVVSTATALASPRFLDKALPASRLEAVVGDRPAVLRDAGCVGWLSEDVVENPADLRDRLVEAGEDLADLTRRLHVGDYEDRDRFRSTMLRLAHGLAGSVAHLLEAADIELVREVRVPTGLEEKQLVDLATSVASAATKQSHYGAFSVHRQLFEPRQFKRKTAMSPTVDAADPVGDLIGSFVLRGPDVHRLREHVEAALSNPADLVEDAPEFVVAVPVRSFGREATAEAATRVLSRRELKPTREAVTLLDGLTDSPWTVAEALHRLAGDNGGRDVRPDEVRHALAGVEAARLLPELPPSVGKIVSALLESDRYATDKALAEAAGVSTRTVRTHRESLAALSLVDVEEDGWRLALSFGDESERYGSDQVWPRFVEAEMSLADGVSEVLAALLPPSEYADPGGNVYRALSFPAEPRSLTDDGRLEGWIEVVGALVEPETEVEERVVQFGPDVEQVSLVEAAEPSRGPTAAAD
jgi:hypothetical protein